MRSLFPFFYGQLHLNWIPHPAIVLVIPGESFALKKKKFYRSLVISMFSLDLLRGLNDVITLHENNGLIIDKAVGRVHALFKYDRRAWNRETDLFASLLENNI